MILAAVLGILIGAESPHWAFPPVASNSIAQDQGSTSSSPPQATPPQTANPSPSSTSPSSKPQTPAPTPKRRAHRKKTSNPDCSSSTSGPADSTNPANTSGGDATKSKPCPPPKVVVKNGGSSESTVELKADTTAAQASYERYTTDQLTAGTEENLKKIAARELTPDQKQTLNQVKEFIEKSKAAVAEGDLERGHNLALKAHLLSDELAKP
jgi:hypothetical protein